LSVWRGIGYPRFWEYRLGTKRTLSMHSIMDVWVALAEVGAIYI
jgi:hypothetical protein